MSGFLALLKCVGERLVPPTTKTQFIDKYNDDGSFEEYFEVVDLPDVKNTSDEDSWVYVQRPVVPGSGIELTCIKP